MRTLIYIFILWTFTLNLIAQPTIQIGNVNTSIGCNNACQTISISHPNYRKTDSYSVSAINYAPISIPSPISLSLGDDTFSHKIPIGFTFCFYGNSFDTCVIGSNGLISFNSFAANTFCYNNSNISLPFNNGTFPNKIIAMPFMDLDPTQGGSITYGTIGTAPTRKFVVKFMNIKLFNGANSISNEFYTVLHESTNEIEVHIANKGIVNPGNPLSIDNAVIGLQDFSINKFITPPSRNGGIWSAVNEAWKFTPSGGPNYNILWKLNNIPQGSNQFTDTICFASAGTHTLTVTYNNICPLFSISDTVIVTNNGVKIDSVTPVNATCKYQTSSAIIHASSAFPPITYAVGSSPYTTSNVITNLAPNTGIPFNLFAKDASGCIVYVSHFAVSTSKLLVDIDTISNLTCHDSVANVCVIAGLGILPYTYNWSNGVTSPCVNNLPFGVQATCIVTDALGCVDSVNILPQKVFPDAAIDSIVYPDCPLGLGYLKVKGVFGTAPYSFLWPNGDTTSWQDSLAGNQIYSVIVTDAVGCSSTALINLKFKKSLLFNFNNILPTCSKFNGTINASTSGTPPVNITFQNPFTIGPTLTGVDSGKYVISAIDANGCEGDTLYELKDTLHMQFANTFSNATCGQNNGIITINLSNAMPPYTYTWAPAVSMNNIGNNLGPGTYTITIQDSLLCTKVISYTLTQSPGMSIVFNNKLPYCDSANGQLVVNVTAGNSPFTYSWTNGPFTSTWNNVYPGIYTVTVSDALNCSISSTALLSDAGTPRLNILQYIPPRCYGDSNGVLEVAGVNGSGPYKYSTDGINFSTNAIINGLGGGNFSFYIQDATSCIVDTILALPIPTPLIINNIVLDTIICFEEKHNPIPLQISGGVLPYQILLNNASEDQLLENLSPGIYLLIVKDSAGCIDSLDIHIPGPSAALSAHIESNSVQCLIDKTGSIHLNPSGGWPPYLITWDNGATSSAIDSLDPGTYSFNLIDQKGCQIDSQFTLLKDSCCIAFLPNVFSPNGDLHNDEVSIIAPSKVIEIELKIFNRYGEIVFQTKDLTQSWDGKMKGQFADLGTYYYLLQYKCDYSNKLFVKKGDINLVK